MKIVVGSDHAGFPMKAEMLAFLREQGHEIEDVGSYDPHPVDFPDIARKVAAAITSGKAERGIALCGSGIGISISVNRHPACRCALVSDGLSARLAREHNDANVVAMGGRLIGLEMAKACLDAFLATPFGGGRHERRVDKLSHPHFAKEPA